MEVEAFKERIYSTMDRPFINNVAIFKARVIIGNRITVPEEERHALSLEQGDEVFVYATRTDIGTDIKASNRDVFETTINDGGEIRIPKSRVLEEGMEEGSLLQVILYKGNAFPADRYRPIQKLLRGNNSRSTRKSDNVIHIKEEEAKFSASISEYGQTKIPTEVIQQFGLEYGDIVNTIKVENGQFDVELNDVSVKSNDRFSVPKDERLALNLDSDDRVTITLEP